MTHRSLPGRRQLLHPQVCALVRLTNVSEASPPELLASPVWLELNQPGGRVEMESESPEKPLNFCPRRWSRWRVLG